MLSKLCFDLLVMLVTVNGIVAYETKHFGELNPIEEIVPIIISADVNSDLNARPLRSRSLQGEICNPDVFEYTATIRDDLVMSYVVTNRFFSVELRYTGEAWIGLGISPDGRGKMVGSQAWIALPLQSNVPSIYDLNAKMLTGIVLGKDQTLVNGTATQSGGITTMRLKKPLNDSSENVPVNGNGENVFIWAFGSDNTLGKHKARGAFRIQLTPCTEAVVNPPETVDTAVVCGLFSLSFFCPISSCWTLTRLIGLC